MYKCERLGTVKAEPILQKSFTHNKHQAISGDLITFREQVVVGCDDGVVYVHSTKTGASARPVKFEGHSGVITSVAASPSGDRVASASADKTVRIWENSNRLQYSVIRGHAGTVRSVAWSPDERFILTSSDDKCVKMFNIQNTNTASNISGYLSTNKASKSISSQFEGTFTGHTNWVRSAAFSCDGRSIISGGDDKTVRLFDVETRKPLLVLYEHEDKVHAVAGHPKHPSVFGSVGGDGNFHVFDARETDQPLVQCYKEAHGGAGVTTLSFHPGGYYATTCGKDGLVRLWDLREGRALWTLQATTAAGFNFAGFDREVGSQIVVGAAEGVVHRFLSNLAEEPVNVGGTGNFAGRAKLPGRTKDAENHPPRAKSERAALSVVEKEGVVSPKSSFVVSPRSSPSPRAKLSMTVDRVAASGSAGRIPTSNFDSVIALLQRLETRISKMEERLLAVERNSK